MEGLGCTELSEFLKMQFSSFFQCLRLQSCRALRDSHVEASATTTLNCLAGDGRVFGFPSGSMVISDVYEGAEPCWVM